MKMLKMLIRPLSPKESNWGLGSQSESELETLTCGEAEPYALAQRLYLHMPYKYINSKSPMTGMRALMHQTNLDLIQTFN